MDVFIALIYIICGVIAYTLMFSHCQGRDKEDGIGDSQYLINMILAVVTGFLGFFGLLFAILWIWGHGGKVYQLRIK